MKHALGAVVLAMGLLSPLMSKSGEVSVPMY